MKTLTRIGLALTSTLLFISPGGWAQDGASPSTSTTRQVTGLGRGGTDTPLYFASSAAATRAVAICSGLWSGNQSLEDIDRYSPLRDEYENSFKTHIDEEKRIVAIQYDDAMPPRLVVWRPVLGCAQLPVGADLDSIDLLPQLPTEIRTPDLDQEDWPLGDKNAHARLAPPQQEALAAVVQAGFDGSTYGGTTWGILVVKNGKIVAEDYDLGFHMHKGAQTHSAAKGFASTLVGMAAKQYGLDLNVGGILQAWTRAGDPRREITLEHLLQMRSGLYGEGNGSPQADIYSNGATVEGRAVSNFLHTRPGTRFLYNPPDTMLALRAVREAVNDDQAYWAMPFTDLFWKIGMTRTVPASDWNGDFLMSGQTYSTARDFARFGLLYANQGKWLGEQLLPEGWTDYVRKPGPVQPASEGPRYGAQFWLYGGMAGLPEDSYGAAGGQGNWIIIIPSENTVVVRRGYDGRSRFNIARFSADVLAAIKGGE